ncbi:MAG: hypothetical protein ACFE9S_10905 [Candidatus Hermodarchaeota archaeon]
MNPIIYKVIFRALEQFENKNLTLSFRNLEFNKPLALPKQFREFRDTSEQYEHVMNFQNIEEVLIIGNPSVEYSFNYYLVILCTSRVDGKRKGFLIGNIKNLGDIIIGLWPFNIHIKNLTREKILNSINVIIEDPYKFSSISIISQ